MNHPSPPFPSSPPTLHPHLSRLLDALPKRSSAISSARMTCLGPSRSRHRCLGDLGSLRWSILKETACSLKRLIRSCLQAQERWDAASVRFKERESPRPLHILHSPASSRYYSRLQSHDTHRIYSRDPIDSPLPAHPSSSSDDGLRPASQWGDALQNPGLQVSR